MGMEPEKGYDFRRMVFGMSGVQSKFGQAHASPIDTPLKAGPASRSGLNTGLDVLQLLSSTHQLNLTEIANGLGKSKSGIHTVLNTLRTRGFVERMPQGDYRLGARAWELGRASFSSEIETLANPHLKKLEDRTNEGVILGVLDGFDVLYLSVFPGNHAVRLNVEVGERIPANLTSTGICLLAALDDKRINAIVPGKLETSTALSIASQDALWNAIERTRRNGYTMMKGGWHKDVGGIAKCIRDATGQPVAAVCVSAPLYRVDDVWYREMKSEIEFTVRSIEMQLN
jgi:DNA-binding IclR family transcriptional regulator